METTATIASDIVYETYNEARTSFAIYGMVLVDALIPELVEALDQYLSEAYGATYREFDADVIIFEEPTAC